jgi:hypothetical protein
MPGVCFHLFDDPDPTDSRTGTAVSHFVPPPYSCEYSPLREAHACWLINPYQLLLFLQVQPWYTAQMQ